MTDVGNRTASQAVDVEIALAVIPDVDIDFIGVVFPGNRKLIRNGRVAPFSFDAFIQVCHGVAENNAFGPGLRHGITASVIGQISCSPVVPDDDKGTVLGNPDILVCIGRHGLKIKSMVGGGNRILHLKPVAVHQCPDGLKVRNGDRSLALAVEKDESHSYAAYEKSEHASFFRMYVGWLFRLQNRLLDSLSGLF